MRPALFCELLGVSLATKGGICFVGQASNEEGIRRLVTREQPQVLLLDYEGLGPNAEGIISRLRRSVVSTRILVLATRSGNETTRSVLQAGASGLVSKDHSFSTVLKAIDAVAAGQVWANRCASGQALERLWVDSSARSSSNGHLTNREAEILAEVRRGLRNKEIAQQLSISPLTVKIHLNNIFRKLKVDRRARLLVGLSPDAAA